MSPSWELVGSAYAGAFRAMSLYLLVCPMHDSSISAAQAASFLGYAFVISGAALEMLMGRYCLTYLICGMATFPLMEMTCPFILARNRTKLITCKPKLNLIVKNADWAYLWKHKILWVLQCSVMEIWDLDSSGPKQRLRTCCQFLGRAKCFFSSETVLR